jgi:uncharacterized delta-60 repeat protein
LRVERVARGEETRAANGVVLRLEVWGRNGLEFEKFCDSFPNMITHSSRFKIPFWLKSTFSLCLLAVVAVSCPEPVKPPSHVVTITIEGDTTTPLLPGRGRGLKGIVKLDESVQSSVSVSWKILSGQGTLSNQLDSTGFYAPNRVLIPYDVVIEASPTGNPDVKTTATIHVTVSPPGDFDFTFGEKGKFSVDFGTKVDPSNKTSTELNRGYVPIDSTHFALFGSTQLSGRGDTDIAISMHNMDGSLDTNFGNNGLIAKNIDATKNDDLQGILIQNDGKIVAYGQTSYLGPQPTATKYFFVRFNQNGTLDTSFGTLGTQFIEKIARGMVVLKSGRIIFASPIGLSPTVDIKLEAYGFDGLPDLNFGQSGSVILDPTNAMDLMNTISVDSQDRIYIDENTSTDIGQPEHYAITRILPQGQIDKTYGINGVFIFDSEKPKNCLNYCNFPSAYVYPNGETLLSGLVFGIGDKRWGYQIINKNGIVDKSFGNLGQLFLVDSDPNFYLSHSIYTSTPEFAADGSFYWYKYEYNPNNTFKNTYFEKRNHDGSLNTQFSSGQIAIDPPSGFQDVSLHIQENNTILMIGSAFGSVKTDSGSIDSMDFLLYRFMP